MIRKHFLFSNTQDHTKLLKYSNNFLKKHRLLVELRTMEGESIFFNGTREIGEHVIEYFSRFVLLKYLERNARACLDDRDGNWEREISSTCVSTSRVARRR